MPSRLRRPKHWGNSNASCRRKAPTLAAFSSIKVRAFARMATDPNCLSVQPGLGPGLVRVAGGLARVVALALLGGLRVQHVVVGACQGLDGGAVDHAAVEMAVVLGRNRPGGAHCGG